MKSIIFVFLLFATVATPLAHAQLLGGLLGIINISGTVPCTANATVSLNGAIPTAVFSNALVELRCGGNVVSSTTTNGSGIFSMVLSPLQFLLSTLLSSACNLVVNTPLSNCNPNLSGMQGLLQSPLRLVGSTLLGILNVTNIIPGGFQLLNGLV